MHECKTVTLRTRPLKNKMLSFYLDYYPGYRDKETMKVIRHESLGIYIYANPKSKREQNFNDVMTEKAEAIRCRRFESVVNERYDFFDRYKLRVISWNTIVSNSASTTRNGSSSISISRTSYTANALLKRLTSTYATSFGNTC